jgi:peptide/nickel transport system substrate-binding protein
LLAGGCVDRPARDGSTFTIVQEREPAALDPVLLNGTSALQWGLLVFSYLTKFDAGGRLTGDLATAVPSLANGGISRDGRTIVYHLRRGVRWQDGALLTARDAVFSIRAVLDPRNNVQSRYAYDQVAAASAPDDATLVLRMRKAFAPALSVVLSVQGFPILPEHVLARYSELNDIDFNLRPIGSGPYRVVEWAHGDHVTLAANETYWRGAPRIKRLVIRFAPNANTDVRMLQTGEADGYFNADQSVYPQLMALRGFRVTRTPVDAVGAIIFNSADGATKDPRVRRALALALDVPTIVAKTYHGALDAREPGRGLFEWAFDPALLRDAVYDPAQARRLLEEAGWRAGPDGVRRKGTTRLEPLLIIQAETPGDAVIANLIRQYEAAVGASVALKSYMVTQFVAPSNLGGPVYGGKFEMALYPFVPGDDPDVTDQFSCANVPPHGYNKSRLCDARVDALLRAGNSTFDVAARKQAYRRLQELLVELQPLLLLYQNRQLNTFSTRLKHQTTSLSGAFWNVGAWSLSP